MTLAELCQAIEEGRLPYTISGGNYEVRAADVRHPRSHERARLALRYPAEIPAGLLDGADHSQLDVNA